MTYELGILGAGNMAEAIARGVTRQGLFTPQQIFAADISPQRRAIFERQLNVRAVEDNREVARQSKRILLSVKPQQMAAALASLGEVLDPRTLIISIAAGVTTRAIETHLGDQRPWRVVRTMPNTPMLIGEGAVAIAPGANASEDDVAQVRRIFEAAATVIEVREDQIDAVTAVSGSGPAYFFFLVEQMIRAGIKMGLSEEHATTLATRTALGAAKMLATSGESAEELRRKVTSPNGTTHAAIEHMKVNNWPQITVDALKAAEQRGKELAGG